MEISVKCFCIMGLLVAVYGVSADQCGPKSSVRQEAMRLIPCMEPAKDRDADVSGPCCKAVTILVQKPACLCAVMLSKLAKDSGVNPEIALTIPMRCNIEKRPVGYKCGDYTLP